MDVHRLSPDAAPLAPLLPTKASPGLLIKLKDLQNAALNGETGRLIKFNKRQKRWVVELVGWNYSDNALKSRVRVGVRPKNLQFIPTARPPPTPSKLPVVETVTDDDDAPPAPFAVPHPVARSSGTDYFPTNSRDYTEDITFVNHFPEIPTSHRVSPLYQMAKRLVEFQMNPDTSHKRISDLSPSELIETLYPTASSIDNSAPKEVVTIKAHSVAMMEGCPVHCLVADSGCTDHLHPRFEDFWSFKRLTNQFVVLPDKSRIPILGVGCIAIRIGGRLLYFRKVYYVPDLRIPLYSLRIHRRLPGCGHFANNGGFSVTFPDFDLEVDDEEDSYLYFDAVDKSTPIHEFDYIQPTEGEVAESNIQASNTGIPRRSRRLQFSQRPSGLHQVSWDDVVAGKLDAKLDALDAAALEQADASRFDGETLSSPPSPPPLIPDIEATADDGALPDGGDSPPIVEDVLPGDEADDESDSHRGSVDGTHSIDDDDDPAPEDIEDRSNFKCITDAELLSFHRDPSLPPPDVRPCDTPNGSDTTQHLTSDIIYKATGNRRFRGKGYEKFAHVLQNAAFVNGGEPLQSIGEFAKLNRRKRGQVLPPSNFYLDKVHVDIVYGDIISKMGFRYALILVDRATKYIWVYGMKSLTSKYTIAALEQFQANAGGLPKEFRTDCDQKLLGGDTRRWIYRNKSKIIGAPAGRQSANGLVERAWQTMCSMARAYLTEAGMSRDYWFFALQHAARMMNMIPAKVNERLTTSFELVHRVKPDVRTWFPLFSVVFFYKEDDVDHDRNNFESDAMIGIAVGRSVKTNALRVYNPTTKQYYEPDTYKFDLSRRPSNEWPDKIQYDGGLYVNLYRDVHHNTVPEPYPPGMPFKLVDDNGDIVTTIVSSIPIRNTEGSIVPDQYLLQAPNGSTIRKTLAEMDELADTPANKYIPVDCSLPMVTSLPVWLQHKSKVSMFKDGEYHKGFIIQASDGTHRFSCRRQLNSRTEEWGVDLPNFNTSWPRMSCDNIMLPSWNINIYSRLGLVPSSNPFDRSGELIAASHVSARTLRSECPKSLRDALANDSVDRATWLASYNEEKEGLVDNQTFVRLTLQQYREL